MEPTCLHGRFFGDCDDCRISAFRPARDSSDNRFSDGSKIFPMRAADNDCPSCASSRTRLSEAEQRERWLWEAVEKVCGDPSYDEICRMTGRPNRRAALKAVEGKSPIRGKMEAGR